jgi:hypothetical protein
MMSLSSWRRLFFVFCTSLLLSGCSVPWKKEFAGILVQMTDGGKAQVYLDSVHLGQTPVEKQDFRPGTYQLRVEPEAPGRQAYETQIHLYAGSKTTVLWSFASQSELTGTGDILELEPLPSKERSELSVITSPEGASVSLNSTTYGLSPVILDEVEPGQYTLSVQAVGHLQKSMSVALQKGYRLHIYSRLEKEKDGQEQAGEIPTGSPSPAPLPSPVPVASPTTTLPSPSPISRSTLQASSSAQTATNFPGVVSKPYATIKDTGTGWLRVRDQASNAGVEVAKVNVGQNYPYVSTLNGWFEITYSPGKNGWISGQYATLVK